MNDWTTFGMQLTADLICFKLHRQDQMDQIPNPVPEPTCREVQKMSCISVQLGVAGELHLQIVCS
jgi:hypothetical protein